MIGSIEVLDRHTMLRRVHLLPDDAFIISVIDVDNERIFEEDTPRCITLVFDDWHLNGGPDYIVRFSREHANKIIDLLLRASDSRVRYPLLVHCYGGVSRSTAIAKFAAWLANIPESSIKRPHEFTPNPLVTKVLEETYKERVLGGVL